MPRGAAVREPNISDTSINDSGELPAIPPGRKTFGEYAAERAKSASIEEAAAIEAFDTLYRVTPTGDSGPVSEAPHTSQNAAPGRCVTCPIPPAGEGR